MTLARYKKEAKIILNSQDQIDCLIDFYQEFDPKKENFAAVVKINNNHKDLNFQILKDSIYLIDGQKFRIDFKYSYTSEEYLMLAAFHSEIKFSPIQKLKPKKNIYNNLGKDLFLEPKPLQCYLQTNLGQFPAEIDLKEDFQPGKENLVYGIVVKNWPRSGLLALSEMEELILVIEDQKYQFEIKYTYLHKNELEIHGRFEMIRVWPIENQKSVKLIYDGKIFTDVALGKISSNKTTLDVDFVVIVAFEEICLSKSIFVIDNQAYLLKSKSASYSSEDKLIISHAHLIKA